MAEGRFVDGAWKRFPDALSQFLTRDPRVTTRALAEELGLPEATVKRWRQGHRRPQLDHLVTITAAASRLRGEPDPGPMVLLEPMLHPRSPATSAEITSTALRLHKLEVKLADAQRRATAFGRANGAASVVAAAVSTERFAAAVWPVREGPMDYRLHVSDRVDFLRLDGTRITDDDIVNDPVLYPALRAVYATPSTNHPRWSPPSSPRPAAHWSIPHLGAPRSPIVSSAWPGVDSILCYAVSKNIWIHEIGALLAMALGYGLTTTRELALASGGRWEEEQFSEQTFRTMQDRLPGRRVVSHNGLRSSPEAALHLLPKPHRDVLPIWVRERDEYLDHLAQRSPRVAHRVRGQLRLLDVALARSNPEPVLVVDMTPSFDRDEQWAEVFRVVAVIMEHLRTAQAIANAPVPPVVRAPLEADRDVGAVLLAYLTHQWQQSGSGLF